MDEFEDSELRSQLQRLGGHGPDDEAAYASLQRRVRVARRRRSVAMLGGLGVVVALGIATLAFNNRNGSQLSPANSGGHDSLVTQTTNESRTSDPASTLPETTAPTIINTVGPTTKPIGPTNTTAAVLGQNGGGVAVTRPDGRHQLGS